MKTIIVEFFMLINDQSKEISSQHQKVKLEQYKTSKARQHGWRCTSKLGRRM